MLLRKGRPVAAELAQWLQRGQLRGQKEKGPDAAAAGGAVPRVRRSSVGLPLQRTHLRGLQGFLPTQHHQECGLPVQVRQQLRDRHVYEAQVPGVPAQKVSPRRHATRVRRARVPVRSQAQGKEGSEGD